MSQAVHRLASSAPHLIAVIIVAGLVGAGLSDAWDALLGTAVSGLFLGSALALGTAGGALIGTRAELGHAGFVAPGRFLAALHGSIPAFVPAVVLTAVAIGGDPATAWIALALPAAAYGSHTALTALDGAVDHGIVVAAMGRGVSAHDVFRRHALPVALARAAFGLGPTIGLTAATAAPVEWLCGVPGAGRMCAVAAASGDVGPAVAALVGLFIVAVALDVVAAAVATHWLPRRAAA